MSAVIYASAGCPDCARVKKYLEHRFGKVTVKDADLIKTTPNRLLRAELFADSMYQDARLPPVYIDGHYQELDAVLRAVSSWEIARNDSGDRSRHDFVFGEVGQ